MSSVPLTQAVTTGEVGAVKAVLANGADVNERTGGGQTPLILATIFNHTHLITLLLDAGADPQLRDNLGLNAIDWAQRRGATEVIDLLSNKPSRTPRTRAEFRAQTPRPRSTTSIESDVEKITAVSEEDRSRRWIAGLKQRIAEQSEREVPDGPNIFRPQQWRASEEHEPQPEIPAEPSTPQQELPATTPEPQPEIPAPPPDPQRDLPAEPQPQEPESPAESPEPEIQAAFRETTSQDVASPETVSSQAAEELPRGSRRKRCPKCNAIYNSDLISYCAHHIVALVDDDQPPIISQPHTTSPALFWTIIIGTLIVSVIGGSLVAAFFYRTKQAQQPQVAVSQPAPRNVQKGTPVVSKELEGKVLSLPIAECPLNGQEAIPGTVVVRVAINRNGLVTEARASGGDWLLRGAASEAAMKSTFAPEKLRGRATEGTISYTFEP